jgi:chemotaxis protein MotB
MTTFSDMMTLLLTFFILLYSISSLDAEKFREIAASLQQVLTGSKQILESDASNGSVPLDNTHLINKQGNEGDIAEIYQKVLEYIREQGLEADVSIRYDQRGVILNINDKILFDTGKANLKPESIVILKKLKGLLTSMPNDIVVEGHTDDVPINTPEYPTNWELSVARAVTVVRYFIDAEGVDPARFSAAGSGEYHPIVPNTSPENRSLNRRVELLIVVEDRREDGNE